MLCKSLDYLIIKIISVINGFKSIKTTRGLGWYFFEFIKESDAVFEKKGEKIHHLIVF